MNDFGFTRIAMEQMSKIRVEKNEAASHFVVDPLCRNPEMTLHDVQK